MGDLLVRYCTLLSILFPHFIVADLNGRYDMFFFLDLFPVVHILAAFKFPVFVFGAFSPDH